MRHTARNLSVLGLGLSASAIVGWLLLRESKREKTPIAAHMPSHTITESSPIPQIRLPLEPAATFTNDTDLATQNTLDAAGETDDLTQINDIGPKFAEALRAIGITQFAQLAQHTPDELAEKLAAHVTVRAQRIQEKNWIGQAEKLAKN